jgi:hypothetical protein
LEVPWLPRGKAFSGDRFEYLWWVFSGPLATGPYEGAYTAMGAFGQYIAIFPKINMVVAHKTKPENGSVGGGAFITILDKLMAARIRTIP